MEIMELTHKNFDETLETNEFVLVDFWAEWCGPCQSFKKVVEELVPKYPDFVFGSVNIDEEKKLAEDFHIRSIPAVMIVRNQVIVYADSGALTASALMELLDQAKSLDPKDLESRGGGDSDD